MSFTISFFICCLFFLTACGSSFQEMDSVQTLKMKSFEVTEFSEEAVGSKFLEVKLKMEKFIFLSNEELENLGLRTLELSEETKKAYKACSSNGSLPLKISLTVEENNTLLGSSLSLKGELEAQEGDARDEENIKYIWMVEHQSLVFSDRIPFKEGKVVSIEVKALGLYSVSFVAIEESGKCSKKKTYFEVTNNPEFVLSSVPKEQLVQKVPSWSTDYLDFIGVYKGWEASPKSGSGIVVAVLDSGINYNHSHLNANYWRNTKEIPNNNIDDDNNGFVDDVLGYDFVNKDSYPFDDVGHGSMVAGLIAGVGFGVAQNAQIMGVKVSSSISGNYNNMAAGIYYAVDNGAHIINISMGLSVAELDKDKALRIYEKLLRAFNYAESKNVLVVVGAGNGDRLGRSINIDKNPIYPASLPNKNILAVAAGGYQKIFDRLFYLALTGYSNYGRDSIDVSAPGGTLEVPIYSSTTSNYKKILFTPTTGTSFSSPLVAGLAAVLLAEAPELSYQEIIDLIKEGGDKHQELEKTTSSGITINVMGSLEKLREYHGL